jgi:hypothetical protein
MMGRAAADILCELAQECGIWVSLLAAASADYGAECIGTLAMGEREVRLISTVA